MSGRTSYYRFPFRHKSRKAGSLNDVIWGTSNCEPRAKAVREGILTTKGNFAGMRQGIILGRKVAVEKTIRFRESWFIRAGLGIALISAVPFALVGLTSVMSRKDIGAGATAIYLFVGAAMGLLFIVLGIVSVILQRNNVGK